MHIKDKPRSDQILEVQIQSPTKQQLAYLEPLRRLLPFGTLLTTTDVIPGLISNTIPAGMINTQLSLSEETQVFLLKFRMLEIDEGVHIERMTRLFKSE